MAAYSIFLWLKLGYGMRKHTADMIKRSMYVYLACDQLAEYGHTHEQRHQPDFFCCWMVGIGMVDGQVEVGVSLGLPRDFARIVIFARAPVGATLNFVQKQWLLCG